MKYSLLITGLLIIALQAAAQVTNPKDVIKQDATDRTNNHISDGVNAGLDKTENTIKGLFGKKSKKNKGETASDVAQADDNSQASPLNADPNSSIRSYQNYDFVPGDTILFSDDFTQDQNGEFPAHWNLEKGQAVINTVTGKPSFCIIDGNYCTVSPRMKIPSVMSHIN